MIEKLSTTLPGVWLLKPQVFGDHRGYFIEVYSQPVFEQLGIHTVFVQDNLSFTQKKGTLRGIHFQNDPMAQAKLVRVNRGAAMDVTVDLRKGSPTYLQWYACELSEQNRAMLYVPRGFGHGFVTLTDDVEFCYKVDQAYSPSHDRGIRYDDPSIGVDWGVVREDLLSDKDQHSPLLRDSDCSFIYQAE